MSPTVGLGLAVAVASFGALLALPGGSAGARDSSEIVFMCGRDMHYLCVSRPDGTGRRRLTRGQAVTPIAFGQVSRAGSLVAFIHNDDTIRVWTLGGRRVQRLPVRWPNPQTVQFDPTGTRLLYTYLDVVGQRWVCRLRLGTRRPSCFRSENAYHAWGPGGTLISTKPFDRKELCVERRGTPCVRRIARMDRPATFFGPPTLSPDGRRLAVTEEYAGTMRVVTFDARTGRRRRVLTTGHWDTNPTWSPDGRWLAFDRDPHGRAEHNTQLFLASVWRVRADGGRPRRVTRHGYQPAWAN
jgi:WD40 repeat protein